MNKQQATQLLNQMLGQGWTLQSDNQGYHVVCDGYITVEPHGNQFICCIKLAETTIHGYPCNNPNESVINAFRQVCK